MDAPPGVIEGFGLGLLVDEVILLARDRPPLFEELLGPIPGPVAGLPPVCDKLSRDAGEVLLIGDLREWDLDAAAGTPFEILARLWALDSDVRAAGGSLFNAARTGLHG